MTMIRIRPSDMKKTPELKFEGHWRAEEFVLPWPITQSESVGVAFRNKLRKLEKKARRIAYKGSSECRLCGRVNGSTAYEYGGWHWPIGLWHYLKVHNVHPSEEFKLFVESQAD